MTDSPSTDSPLTDVVSQQYEKYCYPLPIMDLSTLGDGVWYWFDPSEFQRVLWPDREPRADLDVLVAGCGTNQAAAIAYRNPQAKVVGIDISQTSLDHQRYLKDKHGLWNLEVHRLPIEEVGTLGRDFDQIISTGVLHHTADPLVSMKALGACLRPDGVIGLALYARYGRIGVELMQAVFRDMGLAQDDRSVRAVHDTLAQLPAEHPLKSYLKLEGDWELQYDAAIVDTFLHGRDRSFTVDDCIALAEDASLEFQGWLLNSAYHPHEAFAQGGGMDRTLAGLPERKLWSVMERLNVMAACHFFMACRSDRPKSAYRIDFSDDACLDYVPLMRNRCGLDGSYVYKPRWRDSLSPVTLPFVQQLDGRRTIREIAAVTPLVGAGSGEAGPAERERFARKIFEALWKLDVVTMRLGGAG